MIQSVTQEEMERLLQKEHPAWTSRAIFNEATQLLQGLDNSLVADSSLHR